MHDDLAVACGVLDSIGISNVGFNKFDSVQWKVLDIGAGSLKDTDRMSLIEQMIDEV
jgi:hypothetical protein